MALVEGTCFRGKLGIAVRKTLSDCDGGRMARARERMSPTARELVTQRYIASAWYPVDGIEEVIRVLADELSVSADEMGRRLGRGVGYTGAGTVGRAMVSVFGSPARFEKYLPTMWKQLYDSGTMHARFDPVDRLLSIRVYGWKGHSPLHCFAPLGAVEELARQMGRPRLVEARRVECVSDGAKRCAYELQFER